MMTINQTYLKQCVSYDPETGAMYWLVSKSNRVRVGDMVRGKTVRGYRRVQIDNVRYKAHDIAWLYMTGAFPTHLIDHRDCDPDNLKWSNLRDATQMQNCANRSLNSNSTSGVKGVNWHKKECRWIARVGVGNQRVRLGSFANFDDAVEAVRKYRVQVHGEFANHG